MNLPRNFAYVGLVALIAFAPGCDSSNDPLNSSGALNDEQIQSVVAEVVVPMVSQLDLRTVLTQSSSSSISNTGLSSLDLGGRISSIASGWGASSDPGSEAAGECSPVPEACTSGTFEICSSPQGTSLEFDRCVAGGELLDGSITMVGDASSGTVAFDLSAGDSGLHGSISYGLAGECLSETLTAFTLSTVDMVTSLSGSLEYCADSWPTGSLDLSVTGTHVGSWLYQLSLDGTSTAELLISDLGGGSTFADCTVDLEAETAVCTIG